MKLVKLKTTDSKDTITYETSVDIAKYETVLVRDCFEEGFKVMIAAEDSVEIADSILEYLGKGDYEKVVGIVNLISGGMNGTQL